ncbi:MULTISPECIES: DNA-directed RNA polymerase sigma-70 factor [Robinsoniella]|uniref:RNA polymerase sigma factor n=1 Tax=Robinsoniella peoriensis TaxID=180332 RepID=A0A4V6HS99_9FIRM|nr:MULTISPECIES: DNA-directed RNA polymerase sigma-70 factor [Robinsoniella]MDU7031063.1 sigma-70 family RNA polymerase sigma factor [Clostridiales bacterium]TLD02138.1 RNA polymerase sigma factor [Robinsoniella peoriensis]
MSKRTISIKSGKEEIQMEVTEEEYQNYYRPWWQQKKREQRNRDAKEEKGYMEESYEAWSDGFSESMGIPDCSQPDIDEILEKKILLDVLEEAMESLLPDERELVSKVFSEELSVSEIARASGQKRRTLAFRKDKALEKLRAFFRDRGFDV